MSDMICVGAIAGSYGVQGDVRLKSFCSDPTDIASYGPLFTEDGKRQFAVTLKRPVKGAYAARLTGIASKEEADALKGTQLFVARDALPSLPDDEFYHSDLIGIEVFDTGGVALGRIMAVHDNGAGDLLEIRLAGQKDTLLLPFTKAAVPLVDLAAGRVVADPPEGLGPESSEG